VYNRYIPDSAVYSRITKEKEQERLNAPVHVLQPPADKPEQEELGGKKSGGLAGILKSLKLEELDTGDILLLLIMLFLFLEGDDMELVITLGLILVLSL
jgi:hypothetical protein